MEASDSVRFLAESMSPLKAKFGDRLTLARERNCVQWNFEGHAAIVEFHPGDQLCATFVSAPTLDAATSRPVSAVYRPKRRRYGLTPEGSRAMADDMLAFFSGIREPHFAFVSAYSPG